MKKYFVLILWTASVVSMERSIDNNGMFARIWGFVSNYFQEPFQGDVNAIDRYGSTPLIKAVINNNVGQVKRLLRVPGINVNIKGASGTALMVAVSADNLEIVKELLKDPAINVNIKDTFGQTALISATHSIKILQELLKIEGIDVNAQDKNGYTALLDAVSVDRWDIVRELLKAPDIDVNAKEKQGTTPLEMAVSRNNVESVKDLLKDHRIDVTDKDKLLSLAILNKFLSLQRNKPKIAELFWALGAQEGDIQLNPEMHNAKVEGQKMYGALLKNLKDGNLPAIQTMLNNGYSLMIKNQQNNPLHIAIIHNKASLASWLRDYNKKWLLERGPDGHTPIDLVYGLYGDEDPVWSAFLTELPQEFAQQRADSKERWQMFKNQDFEEGHRGFIQ